MYKLLAIFLVLLFSIYKVQSADSITVYVFLLETCPICQQQTTALQELHEEFSKSGVNFVGLFPNGRVSNEATMNSFKTVYGLTFELRPDFNHFIKNKFDAKITPEVFVYDERNKKMLYSGKIDNRFESVGVRRQVVSDFYLRDALNEIIDNKPVTTASTTPVGCLIMRKPN